MLHPELLRRLCQARDWLREEAEPAPTIRQIARRAGLSTFHFIRVFRAVFGESPSACRARRRILRARELLLLTDRSVTDICLEVGYTSLGSFSTNFRQQVGLSPSGFRRRHAAATGKPRVIPAELIPGCFTLMGRQPEKEQSARSGGQDARAKVRPSSP